MKKYFGALLVALFCLGAPVKAQSFGDIHWSVRTGLNVSNYLNTPSAVDAKAKAGAFFGVGMEYQFDPNWFVQTGLDISLKGSTIKANYGLNTSPREDVSRGELKFNPVYLHIPVHLGYKINLSNGMRLNLSAGPYFAYGLGGKAKFKGIGAAGDLVNKYAGDKLSIFSDSGLDFKRFDFGLGLKAGLDIDMFSVFLGYDYGLVKMKDHVYIKNDIKTNEELGAKNGNFYLGVGLNF